MEEVEEGEWETERKITGNIQLVLKDENVLKEVGDFLWRLLEGEEEMFLNVEQ